MNLFRRKSKPYRLRISPKYRGFDSIAMLRRGFVDKRMLAEMISVAKCVMAPPKIEIRVHDFITPEIAKLDLPTFLQDVRGDAIFRNFNRGRE